MATDTLPDLFSHVLRPEHIRLDLSASTSAEAVRELLQLWQDEPGVVSFAQLEAELLERDRVNPTSLDHGIALRHIRTDSASEILMSIGRSSGSLKSPGGEESIHLLILLATPKKRIGEYLAILSTLARQLSNPARRQQLLAAETPAQFAAILGRTGNVRP